MAIQQNFPNIKPTLNLDFANVGALDPRITFTRASTATYYDGVTTAMAEQNLFLRSQEFDNVQWVANRATVAANTVSAPDGSTTGDTLTEDTNTNSHYLIANNGQSTWSTGTYTHSVYAKLASGTRRLSLNQSFGGVGGYAIFDLSSGTVAATAGSLTAAIVSAGGGWYRCSVTYTTSSTTARFDIALNAGGAAGLESYTGDGTSGIYLWGAQLEQRSSVTAYTPTTTAPITNYIPVLQTAAANVARFDHNPTTGESLGLLIEEQRTNLLTYSEQFDNAAWTKESCTIAANAATAPDGTITADKLVSASATAATRVSRGSIGYNGTHTFSIYAKADGARYAQVIWSGGLSAEFANFDLQTGAVVGGTAGMGAITAVGNGWYRCSITTNLAASPATGTPFFGVIDVPSAARGATYTGNGYSGIYIWGAQLEAGAFPTSYIPTVASQVTRSADVATMTGANFSSWYRADEGTLFAEAFTFNVPSSGERSIFRINSNSLSNEIRIRYVDGTLRGQIQSPFGETISQGAAASSGVFYKTVLAYKENDSAFTRDGGAATTDTSVNVPTEQSQAGIGIARPVGGAPLNGTIRKIAYYPRRLTNPELQGLTS